VLTLAVAALLSNHLSVLAIAEWGADQPPERLAALGLLNGAAPHQSTLQRLFRKLDPTAVSDALTPHLAAPSSAGPPPRGSQGVAVDGKAQRGRLRFPQRSAPVHAISAVAHRSGLVLAQLPLGVHGDKAAAELTVVPALIARLDWRGRVFTGDAL